MPWCQSDSSSSCMDFRNLPTPQVVGRTSAGLSVVFCFFFSPVGGHENHAICARKKHGRMLHKAIDIILGKGWHFTYFTISPNFWTRPTMGLPISQQSYSTIDSRSSFMGQHWPLLIGILLTWLWTNNFRLSKFQGDWTPQSYSDNRVGFVWLDTLQSNSNFCPCETRPN